MKKLVHVQPMRVKSGREIGYAKITVQAPCDNEKKHPEIRKASLIEY